MRVGDTAYAAGLPVWELSQHRADLEALFFSLTEGTNRNLGQRQPGPATGEVA